MGIEEKLPMEEYIEILDSLPEHKKTVCSYFSTPYDIQNNGKLLTKKESEPTCLYYKLYPHLQERYGHCKHYNGKCTKTSNYDNYIER